LRLQWVVDEESFGPARAGMKHIVYTVKDQSNCIVDALLRSAAHDPVLVRSIQSTQVCTRTKDAEKVTHNCGIGEHRELPIGIVDDSRVEVSSPACEMEVNVGRSRACRRVIAAQLDAASLVGLQTGVVAPHQVSANYLEFGARRWGADSHTAT